MRPDNKCIKTIKAFWKSRLITSGTYNMPSGNKFTYSTPQYRLKCCPINKNIKAYIPTVKPILEPSASPSQQSQEHKGYENGNEPIGNQEKVGMHTCRFKDKLPSTHSDPLCKCIYVVRPNKIFYVRSMNHHHDEKYSDT